MKIEVSNGEIVDKLTILLIKKDNIKDSETVSYTHLTLPTTPYV